MHRSHPQADGGDKLRPGGFILRLTMGNCALALIFFFRPAMAAAYALAHDSVRFC